MSLIFSLNMIKKIIKKFIPKSILKYREKYIVKKKRNQFLHMNNNEIFKKIYLEKLWCPENEKKILNFIPVLDRILQNYSISTLVA